VSPRMALRRWPMCAALLGLMLVCSTRRNPDTDIGVIVGGDASGDGDAVEADVEVAGAGDFDGGDARDRAEICVQVSGQFGGDGAGALRSFLASSKARGRQARRAQS